jgi:hypothetical protein
MMATSNSLFKYGTVISVDDEFDGDRVKVYVKGIDPVDFSVDDIPYAFPLLPKQLYVKPKVGEYVFCFTQNGSYDNDRFWIGPIISQPHKLTSDPFAGLSFLNSGLVSPDNAPSTNPNNAGVQLESNDVGIQGRGNTDVIVKPSEVRIRAGKSLDNITLNKTNPSYVQVKYNTVSGDSSVNIVSDNINILSHKGSGGFGLVDSESLITDEEYANILNKAHQLPFGDVLIELLDILIKAFSTHVHAYPGLPPDLTQTEVKKLLSYDLSTILSKNIRIN